MERERMKCSEAIAKRVFEAVFPGATMNYRPNQSHREYDFELRYGDGTTAAVEVTAAVDSTLIKTSDAIQKKKKGAGGPTIRAKICKRSWIVFTASGSDIRKIRADADGYLAALEVEGIDDFFCADSSPAVQKACGDLGITGGAVIPSDGDPTITIEGPGGGGAVDPPLAVEAGECEAWKEDNRRKLGAAATAERHLAVYVSMASLPWMALTSFPPPANKPRIPPEIKNLWLIGQGKDENEFVVWCAGRNENWQSMKVACQPEMPKTGGHDGIE